MIEATCSACGTPNRIAEADVPVGAKFVTCASCKSRVALPARAAAATAPQGERELADLPAPRRQSGLGAADLPAPKPAPKSGLAAFDGDLPAPRPKAPSPLALELDELVPARPATIDAGVDLPAPKASRPVTPRPTPDPADNVDLPAPRASRPSVAPRTAGGPVDLPAPRSGSARALTDLPEPAHDLIDLPSPKAGGAVDLPAPKAGGLPPNLPAPKAGGIPDLPAPKAGALPPNLPAPKAGGLPSNLPTPKAGVSDLPTPKPGQDLPAPKGFFDDLPQPSSKPAQASNEVAPKGFFDDLPQPSKKAPGTDVAPKGFFDDLPQPSKGSSKAIDLGDPIEPLDLGSDDPPPLDLGEPGPSASTPSTSFDDLDLSAPSAPQSPRTPPAALPPDEDLAAAVKFAAPKKGAAPSTTAASIPDKAGLPALGKNSEVALELEEPRQAHGVSQRLGPKPKEEARINEVVAQREKAKRRKLALAGMLGLALLGGGGFYMYKRHAAQQERADAISEQLGKARKALASDDMGRWQRAASAAGAVLELEPNHGEALGISAEASIAGAIADGKAAAGRIAKGKKQISDALSAGTVHPALERAQALSTVTANPSAAPPKLEALLAKNPKDTTLAIYLGWAYAAANEPQKAIDAFTKAEAGPKGNKILALLGRAKAKLAAGDAEGARTDFRAVFELDSTNVPAQVGLAAARPATEMQQQETDLLAVLASKEAKDADPRALVQAWNLAADVARKGGRLDAARERYRKALKIDDRNLGAMTGLAEVELRDNKLEAAAELISKALVQDKDHVGAQLAQAELSMRKGERDDATKRIEALAGRTPPLLPRDVMRLEIVRGKLREVQRDDAGAVEAYIAAAKAAGDLDLSPTMLAVNKLAEMAKAETDPAKAATLKARAEELLAGLATSAEKDPQLASALGAAYFQAGDPAKAEPWLRKVAEQRPNDADAQYQLGRVLRALARGSEAVTLLEGAWKLAPDRAEIGLELARTLELLGRNDEAGKLYDQLLTAEEPSLELRAHAGEFYVKTGQMEKAGEQGRKILEVDRAHADGLYLHGEGLLASGQLDEARRTFQAAAEAARTARHLDAVGRASESVAMLKGKDYLSMQDAALRSYMAALEIEPTRFSSLIGMGRLYVARREMAKALGPLAKANQLRKNDPEVAFLLGTASYAIGTKEQKKVAVQWLQIANAGRPTAETAYMLGTVYMDADINDERGAIGALASATKLAQQDQKKTDKLPDWYPEALYQLGNLANGLGDERQACDAWKLYKGTNPKPSARTKDVDRFLATSLRNACP